MGSHALHTRYVPNQLAVPLGTTKANPFTATWDLGWVVIESLEVLIPPGHAGLTGLAVAYSGQQLLPWANTNQWLIGNNLDRSFEFHFEVGRPITLSGYNLDIFAHTFYLLAKVTDLPRPDAVAPLTLLDLNAGA